MGIEFKPATSGEYSFEDMLDGDIVRSVRSGLWYIVCKNKSFTGVVSFDQKGPTLLPDDLAGGTVFYRLRVGDSITITKDWG